MSVDGADEGQDGAQESEGIEKKDGDGGRHELAELGQEEEERVIEDAEHESDFHPLGLARSADPLVRHSDAGPEADDDEQELSASPPKKVLELQADVLEG